MDKAELNPLQTMKVYTHYKTIEEFNVGYRWRTILQFGSSWNVIGSVVMMNPGSANYKYGSNCWIEDETILDCLRPFDYLGDQGEIWFEFNADATMGCIADLFAQYYGIHSQKDLQGVIQIFNLFYLREPNLGDALMKNKELSFFKQINDAIFEYDIAALKQPVYLGFGGLARTSDFREKAMLYFFEVVEKHNAKYLDEEFDKNSFTHPLRLMRYIKNKPEGIIKRQQFCTNSVILND